MPGTVQVLYNKEKTNLKEVDAAIAEVKRYNREYHPKK